MPAIIHNHRCDAGVGGRGSKSGISHGKGKGHVVHAGVAVPTHVGAWFVESFDTHPCIQDYNIIIYVLEN